jgi:hypothetical protein
MPQMIDEEAGRLIREHQSRPPVDVGNLARALGLNVWESSVLPNSISGKLFRDAVNGGPAGYSVIVRAQDPFVRKRFTIAHEIAHFLLHRDLFKQELIDDALYRSGLTIKEEVEANRVAADILMPWHLLSSVSTYPFDQLATMFQVSEQAMRIRLDGKRLPNTTNPLVTLSS